MKVAGSGETLHINYLQAQDRFAVFFIPRIIIDIIIHLQRTFRTLGKTVSMPSLIIVIFRGKYSCTASTSLDSATSSTELRVVSEPPKITSLPTQLGEVIRCKNRKHDFHDDVDNRAGGSLQVASPLLHDILSQVVGGSLLLACTATGLPPPRITFKNGETEFSGEELDHGENFSTVQLSLSHLTTEQEGSYMCVAVNEYGADRASIEVCMMHKM